jgi:hypothetical protein
MSHEGIDLAIYIVGNQGTGYRQIYPERGERVRIETSTEVFYRTRQEDVVVWGMACGKDFECEVKQPVNEHRQIEFNVKIRDDVGDLARCLAASVEALLQIKGPTTVAVFLE